jgi:signal transduction histidine kinase
MNDTPRRPPFGPPHRAGLFLLPIVIGFIQVFGTYMASRDQHGHRAYDLLAALLLVAGPAALTLRSRYPVAVLAVTLAVTATYVLLDYPRGPVFFALIVAFFAAVMAGRRLPAIAFLIGGYLIIGWGRYFLRVGAAPQLEVALGVAAWLLVLLSVAEFARSRRERALESARMRAEEARRRATEERLRIARELHDVLAHNISLISVQAGVALHLIDEQPEQARSALGAIKDASNEALAELRSVLDILRHGNEEPPRSPTSGLNRLDDLVARTEGAGLRITTNIDGVRRPVPPGVDRAAYRIIQEALTNVARHADTSAARVDIAYQPDALVVQIDDDGRGSSVAPTSNGGRGIAGMRERVAALHGHLEAGPRPGGGFRVRARLPLDSRPVEDST